MIDGFITVLEASKKYNKHVTSIRRKIKPKEWIESRGRKVEVLEEGKDAIRIGNTWLIKIERLEQIYGNK